MNPSSASPCPPPTRHYIPTPSQHCVWRELSDHLYVCTVYYSVWEDKLYVQGLHRLVNETVPIYSIPLPRQIVNNQSQKEPWKKVKMDKSIHINYHDWKQFQVNRSIMQFLHVGGDGSPSLYGYSVILVDVELDFSPLWSLFYRRSWSS